MKKAPLDTLINTIATNHGVPLPATAVKRKVRDPLDEDQDREGRETNTESEPAQDATTGDSTSAPVLLAQADPAGGTPDTGAALAGGSGATTPASAVAPANTAHDIKSVLPWLGLGGLALATAGGSGSGAAAGPGPVAADNIVTGTVVAGPVISGNGLKVEIYAANGTTKLGESTLDATGKFTVNIGPYTGVVIARVVDSGTGNDYLDEATGVNKDLNATLMATTVVPGGTITLNINPLTADAAQKAGLAADGTGSLTDPSAVTNANAAVAAAFGLTDLTGTPVVATNSGSYNVADGVSQGEKYGAILAALSGSDQNNGGNSQTTINNLVNAVTVSGASGTLSPTGQAEVVAGAATADANVAGNASTTVGNILAGNAATDLSTALNKIAAYANSNTNAAPTIADYAAAGVTGVNANNLTAVNAVIDGAVQIAADTTPKIQALIDNIDTTPPTVTITTNDTALLAGETATLTFTLSEAASNFAAGDITVTGGTLSNFSGSGTSYTATFTPTANSTTPASVNVAGASFTDAAGNGNTAATTLNMSVDTTLAPPTVTVTDDEASVGNVTGGNINYTFTFSRPVTGFTVDDITVINGAKGSFSATSATVYTLVVTPTAGFAGDVTVDVARAAAADASNTTNTSSAAVQSVQAVDMLAPSAPTIAIVATDDIINAAEAGSSITGTKEAGATVTFSIAGSTRSVIDNGTTWSYALTSDDITNLGQGTKNLSATQTDSAGNTSTAGTRSITMATAVPSVAITSNKAALKVGETATITFTFSEAPTGFADADITVTGGTLGVISGTGTSYTATFTPNANLVSGSASITVAGGSYTNAAGSNGSAGTTPTISIDTVAPTASSLAPADGANILPSGNLVLTFSENIAKGTGNIRLVDDTATSITTIAISSAEVTVSGNTLTLNPNADLTGGHNYHLEFDATAINDTAGNAWAGINNATDWNFVATSPAISLNAIAIDNRVNAAEGASAITVSGTVSSNSTTALAAFTTANFTVTLTPQGGGSAVPVTVTAFDGVTGIWSGTIAANTLVDAKTYDVAVSILGTTGDANGLTTSTTGRITTDLSAPSAAAIDAVATDNTLNASEQGSLITGSKEAGATVALSIGGNIRATTDNGTTWSYALTAADIDAMGQGTKTLSATQTDLAGNTSTAGTRAITVDTAAPLAPTFDSVTTDNIINAAEVGTTLTGFNEAGATVALSVGGTPRTATVSGTNWSYTLIAADITNLGQGTKTLSVTQTDAAGNTSTVGSQTIVVDTVVPTVAIASNDSALKAGETATITFTFSSAPGTSFTNDDITVAGGTLSQISATSSTVYTATFTPAEGLAAGSASITVANGSYTNASGTAGTAGSTPSISIDTEAPAPVSFQPVDDTNVLPSGNLVLNFSQNIAKGTGNVRLVNDTTNTTTTIAIGDAQVTVSGSTLTINPTADLVGGQNYHIEIDNTAITDAAGNTWAGINNAGSWNFTASTPAISLNALAVNNTVNATENGAPITVSGTVASNDSAALLAFTTANFTVTLTPQFGGTPIAVTVSNYDGASGVWSGTVAASTLQDGTIYTVAVTILGTTGAASGLTASTSGSVEVDLLAVAPIINTVAGDNTIGASEVGSLITGTAEAGASVALSIASNTRSLVANKLGEWSYALTSADITAMGEGAETLSATQTDVAGNTSTAGTRTITVSTDASPAPTFNAVATDNRISAAEAAGTLTFTGTNASDASVALDVAGNTRTATVNGTTWSYTLVAGDIAALGQGKKTLIAVQTDSGGNITSVNRAITIDTVAPTPFSLQPVDGTTVLPSGNLVLTFNEAIGKGTGNIRLVNDTAGTTTTISITDAQISVSGNTLTLNPTADLTGGSAYHLEFDNGAITDLAGNAWAGISNATTWNFTAATPSVSLNAIATDNRVSATENASAITVSGTVASNDSAALAAFVTTDFTVTLTPQGGGTPVSVAVTSYDTATGAWSGSIAANTLVDSKTYDVAVSLLGHSGAASNLSSATKGSVTVSLTAPAPTINVIATDDIITASEQTAVITGTNADGATVQLAIGGFAQDATESGTTWSYTLTDKDISNLGQGTKILTVFQTDAAGNSSGAARRSITVDTLVPTATLQLAIPAVQLEAIGNVNATDTTPQVTAVGSTGAYVVTWNGQDSDGDNTIFVQQFNADGTTTGNAPVQLEAIGNLTGSDSSPQVTAVGSSGAYVVTWRGQESAGDYSIFVQQFNADGTTTGNAPVQLEAIGNFTGSDTTPQVTAVGSSGAYVVAWVGQDSAGDASVFVQKFNANGTTTGNAPVQLEAIGKTNGIDDTPQVTAVGSSGAYVVTWRGLDSSGDNSIFVQQFNANGTTTGNAPVQLEAIGNTTATDNSPQVTTLGSSGAYVVTWEGQDSRQDNSIFVQQFNANGTTTGNAPVQLEATGNVTGFDGWPRVTDVGSSGAYVVTWFGQDNSSLRDISVFVQQFNANGTITNTTIAPAGYAKVQSTELGTAYLVHSNVTVSNLASITSAADNQWNQVAISAIKTATNLAATGLADGQYRVYTADAAGNLSAAATGTVTVDGTVPTVSSVAMTSATGALNNVLSIGDVVSITATMSEATMVTGTPQLALNIGGTTVQANYASGSGTTALVFTYTIAANLMDANGISIAANSLSLNGGILTDGFYNAALTQTAVTDNASYMVDATAPIASVTAAAIANTGNALVQSNELGTAYLVRNTETVTSVADITGLADAQFNSVAITTAFTATNLSVAGLEAGVYKVYTADAAGNLSAAARDTVLVTNTTNASQMNLTDAAVTGNEGGLIAPVYVDGQWFMYWDRSGDGTNADTTGTVFGAGTGNGNDRTQHNDLDAIFRFGSDFTTVNPSWVSTAPANGSNDTTNTYRYSTLNGVKLALPTAPSIGSKAGTDIDNSPAGETNTTYDDLLAIWDAHNGTTTTTGTSGVPAGWASSGSNSYWAATPGTPFLGSTANIHLGVIFTTGTVNSYADSGNGYVALQVL